MSKTIESAPRETGVHPLLPQAVALHQANRLDEAATMYRMILAQDPQQFDAAHLLGVISLQEGRLSEAQSQIIAALQIKPEDRPALNNLTVAYLRDGQLELAARWGEQAARLLPPSVDALITYGTVLHRMGRYRDAIGPLEIAQHVNPRSTIVCNLLGDCLLEVGDAPRAVTISEIATTIAPNDRMGWSNLSKALEAMGERDRAAECAKRAAELDLDSSNALAAQAAAQFELGKVEEAIVTYKRAVELNGTVIALCDLARALVSSGRHDEAVPYLMRALSMEPNFAYARMMVAVLTIQSIYESRDKIQESRVAFQKALQELQSWYSKSSVKDAYSAVGAMQPFFIAYQPFNNRELLSLYGDICARWMMTLPAAASRLSTEPRRGKFRIGIVSAHVRDHSVWNAIIKGWLHQMDKTQFELFLFKLDTAKDNETRNVMREVARFHDTPNTLAGWADTIRTANLDALIYDEVGMDALTLQLSALRLAPLQAVTWGHPETTGLPTMDFYLSAAAFEPPNAQDNYRERLVALPNLGVYVEPLQPDIEPQDLRAMGLPRNEPLLLCAGLPFKYSPLHDWVWAEIARGLRAAGRGRLVLFSTSSGSMHLQLGERLRASFALEGLDFDSTVCVIPFLNRQRFYGLMKQSTLMLDTLDFSGFNTALQAIECDLPYLAYEGKFMRGRLASGIMRRMELPDLVASSHQEFAQRAVALATDPSSVEKLRSAVIDRRQLLFRDTAPIRALETFLSEEIGKLRSEALRTTNPI